MGFGGREKFAVNGGSWYIGVYYSSSNAYLCDVISPVCRNITFKSKVMALITLISSGVTLKAIAFIILSDLGCVISGFYSLSLYHFADAFYYGRIFSSTLIFLKSVFSRFGIPTNDSRENFSADFRKFYVQRTR